MFYMLDTKGQKRLENYVHLEFPVNKVALENEDFRELHISLFFHWGLLSQVLMKLPKALRKLVSRAIWIWLSSFRDQIQLIYY